MSKAAWRYLVDTCLTDCNNITVEPGWEPVRVQPVDALRELLDTSVRDAVQSEPLPALARNARQITLVLPVEQGALGADLLTAMLDLLGAWGDASIRALLVPTGTLRAPLPPDPALLHVLESREIPWVLPRAHVHRPPVAGSALRAPHGSDPLPLAFHPWLLDTDLNLLLARVRHDPLFGVSAGWLPLVLGGGSPRLVQALLSDETREHLGRGMKGTDLPLLRTLRRAGRMLAPSFAVLECADGDARAIASGDPGAVSSLLHGLPESPLYRFTEEVDAMIVLLEDEESVSMQHALATGLLACRHPQSALAPGAPLVLVSAKALLPEGAHVSGALAPDAGGERPDEDARLESGSASTRWTLRDQDIATLARSAGRVVHLVWPESETFHAIAGVQRHTSLRRVLRELELNGRVGDGAPLSGVLLTRGVSHILPLANERRERPDNRPPLRGDT